MIAEPRAGALMHFKTILAAVIEAAAHTYGAAPFAVCCVDQGDEHGRRFARTLHDASRAALDPVTFIDEHAPAACLWCRAAPIAVLASVTAEVLGSDMSAAIDAVHAAGAVPVVIVHEGVAMVECFDRSGAS